MSSPPACGAGGAITTQPRTAPADPPTNPPVRIVDISPIPTLLTPARTGTAFTTPLVPPATLVAAVACLCGAFVFSAPSLLALAGGLFVLAFGLFVLAPLRAMSRRD